MKPVPAASNRRPAPPALVLWILFCAYCNCCGWILSATHQLNVAGYAIASVVAFIGLFLVRDEIFPASRDHWTWGRYRHRFKHAFPLAFFILAAMALLGGALYGPSNYDALAYRIPRVLHWLTEGHWHWIHAEFNRLNSRACGIEWVSVPVILATNTDRFVFLINAVSFLLMPGLVFALFTRLGVRPRVAWHWMWIVPTAYCFLLQAGSIGNDLFGAVFPLAALVFALRARQSQKARDIWLSILSAAMMTAAKSSNLPLLLPWAIASLPSVKLLLRRPLVTAAVCAVAFLASFGPTALLNRRYCGDWTGLASEPARIGAGPLWLHLGANTFLLTIQNFVPPVFPFSNQWNHAMREVVPPWLNQKMEDAFEPGAAHFILGEMEIEEEAGLGFGVSMLLLVSLTAAVLMRLRRRNAAYARDQRLNAAISSRPKLNFHSLVLLCAWVAFLVFISRLGLTTIARLITPYYCLLLPLFLLGQAHSQLIKRGWWRGAAMAVFVIAAGLLVLSPARPLWPANAVLSRIGSQNSSSRLLGRAKTVYSVYSQRNDGFAPVRKFLPPGLRILGFISYDDPETSLWRPFGSRRIEHVLLNESAEEMKNRGIEYVLVNSFFYTNWTHHQFESWLAEHNAEIVQTIPLALRAAQGPIDWYLVRLK